MDLSHPPHAADSQWSTPGPTPSASSVGTSSITQARSLQRADPPLSSGATNPDSPQTPPLPSTFPLSTDRSAVSADSRMAQRNSAATMRAKLNSIAARRRRREAVERCSGLDTGQQRGSKGSLQQRLYDAVHRDVDAEKAEGGAEATPREKVLARIQQLQKTQIATDDRVGRFAMIAQHSGETPRPPVGDITPRPGRYLRGKQWTDHKLEMMSQKSSQLAVPAQQEQRPSAAHPSVVHPGGDQPSSRLPSTLDRFLSPGRTMWIGTPKLGTPQREGSRMSASLSPLCSPRRSERPSAVGSEGSSGGATRQTKMTRPEPVATSKVVQTGDQSLILQSLWDRLIYESAIIREDVTEWEEQSIIIQRLAQLLMIEEDPTVNVSCLGQMLDEDRKRIFFGYGTELLRLMPILRE